MPAEQIALFISLYIDEDVHRDLPPLLRVKGFEVISAHDLKQKGPEWNDERQLEFAVEQECALLSHNRDHYLVLDAAYRTAGKEHYGILIAPQLPIGELARRLLRLLDSVTAGEMKDTFRYL
jgi:hypothetical protein